MSIPSQDRGRSDHGIFCSLNRFLSPLPPPPRRRHRHGCNRTSLQSSTSIDIGGPASSSITSKVTDLPPRCNKKERSGGGPAHGPLLSPACRRRSTRAKVVDSRGSSPPDEPVTFLPTPRLEDPVVGDADGPGPGAHRGGAGRELQLRRGRRLDRGDELTSFLMNNSDGFSSKLIYSQ